MEFLSIFLPILIDTINTFVKDSTKRFWVAFVVCAIVGALMNWIATQYHFTTPQDAFDSITKTIMTVFGIAQVSYKALWEKTDMRYNFQESLKNSDDDSR